MGRQPEKSGKLRRIAFSSSLVVAATIAAGGTSANSGAHQLSGFVTASGRSFMLNGAAFRFIGFNAYGMAGCYDGSPWTTARLDAYFSKLPANGVTRIWAFRSAGADVIASILTEAAKYNQRLILTLGDDDSACGETDGAVGGAGSGKTKEFYREGWKNRYLAWVNTIVPAFKDNPSIMMWEVANEPGQAGYLPTASEMQAYLKGASDAIRAADPNHLIGAGANYPGNFRGAANYTAVMKLPNIDAVSFHEYSYEYEKGAVVSGNFASAKQASQVVNKPFYAGEVGVRAGATCGDVRYSSLSLDSRLNFLKQKTDDYFANGIGGVLYWEYEPHRAGWVADCAYEMYPSDPMVPMVQNYVIQ
jgi:hypothetical protein